jgi:hypothetical protein
MAKDAVVESVISCRLITTSALGMLVVALALAPSVAYPSEDKPNRVERTASRAAKGTENTARRAGKFVEKTAKRSGKFVEKTATRAGKFVERTATKTERAVKRAIE